MQDPPDLDLTGQIQGIEILDEQISSKFPFQNSSSPAVVTVAQGIADNLANNALLQLAAVVAATVVPVSTVVVATVVVTTSTPVKQVRAFCKAGKIQQDTTEDPAGPIFDRECIPRSYSKQV